ncbi:MAG: GTPase ObgE [Myxococcota bacterium]
MQFVDEVEVEVVAGHGGKGCVAFRREKYRPMGGPSGGDGGRGGSVIFHAHDRLSTLLDLRYRRRFKAENGEPGRGKDQFGADGKDHVVLVPVGTQVYDAETDELIADLDEHDERIVVAQGGLGGRGNMRFATPKERAPRRADDGRPGEHRRLRLELKLMADVGLVGFPNVGKSTFIGAISRATPKIADYPFTTLTPNLGVASLGDERSFVVADIPGIIEGASEGAGLGLRFLRHAERNRVLLHVLTADPDPEREPLRDFDRLMGELTKYSESLSERPMVVGISKMDLPDVRELEPELRAALEARGHRVFSFSAATGEGLTETLEGLEQMLKEHPREALQVRLGPTASERPHGDAKGFPERDSES